MSDARKGRQKGREARQAKKSIAKRTLGLALGILEGALCLSLQVASSSLDLNCEGPSRGDANQFEKVKCCIIRSAVQLGQEETPTNF